MNKPTFWLVGMPNVGKSSLFKKITKKNVKVANWEGVTIRCRSEAFQYGQIVDTPGRRHVYMHEPCWSMPPTEWVGVAYYRIIQVVDAAFLERDLVLTAQWLTLGVPVGVVIHRADLNENLDDEGIAKWSSRYNVPIITTNLADVNLTEKFEGLVAKLGQQSVQQVSVQKYADAFERNNSMEIMADWFQLAGQWSRMMLKSVEPLQLHVRTKLIDQLFLKSRFAPLLGWIFLCLSLLIILWLGQITQLIGQFTWNVFTDLLVPVHWRDFWLLKSVLDSVDVLVGLMPLIFLVYVWLASMEHSGYGLRLGVLLTPVLRWAGLPGGVWISMMLGFGCNVPAIQALKTIPYPKHRLIAATMLPMIPCSARLMVFVVIAGMMNPLHASWMVLSLYVLSMLVVLLIARILAVYMKVNHTVFQSQRLVPYQQPQWVQVFQAAGIQSIAMIHRVMLFVLPLNIFLAWLDQTAWGAGNSLLVEIGHVMSYLFYPIGMTASDWPFVMALLTGLVAKEAMLATLGSLGMVSQMMPQPETWQELWAHICYVSSYLFMLPTAKPSASTWSIATTMSYLIFVSLYMPCVSTYAILRKVIGWRANIVTVGSVILAYGFSLLLYLCFHVPVSIYIVLGACVAFVITIKRYMRDVYDRA